MSLLVVLYPWRRTCVSIGTLRPGGKCPEIVFCYGLHRLDYSYTPIKSTEIVQMAKSCILRANSMEQSAILTITALNAHARLAAEKVKDKGKGKREFV